jgi:hypothetical protein
MNVVYVILIAWTTKGLFSIKVFSAAWRSVVMGLLSVFMLVVLLVIIIFIISIQLSLYNAE